MNKDALTLSTHRYPERQQRSRLHVHTKILTAAFKPRIGPLSATSRVIFVILRREQSVKVQTGVSGLKNSQKKKIAVFPTLKSLHQIYFMFVKSGFVSVCFFSSEGELLLFTPLCCQSTITSASGFETDTWDLYSTRLEKGQLLPLMLPTLTPPVHIFCTQMILTVTFA